jgi:hypothetical protein
MEVWKGNCSPILYESQMFLFEVLRSVFEKVRMGII